MTHLSEEEKKHLQYQIYAFRYDDPWIPDKRVAKLVTRSITTVNRYAKQAEEKKIILNPHLRLKSPAGKTALLLFEDKWKAFNELQNNTSVKYLCVYQGDWNILAAYEKSMDFSCIPGFRETMVEGQRGEIFTPKVEYISWEASFKKMEALLKERNVKKSSLVFQPCCPDWDEDGWKMYEYFRPNLRKRFTHLRKQHPISWRKYQEWKSTLKDNCAILVSFFPEGYHAYDCFTLCFRTEYEKYIVELFSKIPTTPNFYKIENYFLGNIYILKDYQVFMRVYEIISQLIERGIITDYREGKGVVTWHDRVLI